MRIKGLKSEFYDNLSVDDKNVVIGIALWVLCCIIWIMICIGWITLPFV